MKISINDLNENGEISLLPKFIPDQTKLERGRLQLPKGSEIFVDETSLESGQLNEQGIKVLTALGDIAQFQRMHYDFVYYQKEFDAEYNVTILSDYKSLIKVLFTIIFSEFFPHIVHFF